MKIKGLRDEDFVNYKKASMFIAAPSCTFKCDRENGCPLCQNFPLAREPIIEISTEDLIQRYLDNPITHAIVFGGLEPLDSFDEVLHFIKLLRTKYHCEDDVVIYTGYNEIEILEPILLLKYYNNVIVKFGRYKSGQDKHYDDVLGVYLASDNQYAQKLIPHFS